MNRRLAFPLALIVSVFSLSLASSHATTRAQQPQRSLADTGIVSVGPNQVLRVYADLGDTGTHEVGVRFKRMTYAPAGCNGDGVCRLAVASEDVTPLQWTAGPVEIQIMGATAVRAIVESNSRDMRVTAAIVDTVTGATVSHITVPNGSQKLD